MIFQEILEAGFGMGEFLRFLQRTFINDKFLHYKGSVWTKDEIWSNFMRSCS